MAIIPAPTREQQPWILSAIPETFVLKVLDPQQILFVGKVHALASANYKGSFDILPGHVNLISIIYKNASIFPELGDQQEFVFDVGILRFVNNAADLYVGLEFSQVLDQVAAKQGQQLRQELKLAELGVKG